MLNYKDLSPAKRKWVDLVEIHFPQYTDTITYEQLNIIHAVFTAKRNEDRRFKCSKPLWLISNNAVSRGVYKFPGSKDAVIEEVLSEDEKMYRAELSKYGIDYSERNTTEELLD
jgi:hypothetical protein